MCGLGGLNSDSLEHVDLLALKEIGIEHLRRRRRTAAFLEEDQGDY